MNKIRSGCKDIWNALMVKEAKWSDNDIPFCPTTATVIPKNLISFVQAKTIYNKSMRGGDINFFVNAFVHFYIDDYKFDNKSGIWIEYDEAVKILVHFAGIITPDFSTCADFPCPIKFYN